MNRRLRKIKCWFGIHGPDTATIKDNGKTIIQRCLYCDRVVHRFERDHRNRIRRVN